MFFKRCFPLSSVNCYLKHFFIDKKKVHNQKPLLYDKMVLYGDEASPPVRFVMMTASMLNIPLDFHMIDLFKSENKTDFYTKINPMQKVPALLVNGEVICDSHAIALYLCGTRNNQHLYPKNQLNKAIVDQMLFFNATNLFPIDSYIFSEYFAKRWPVDEHYVKQWYSSLNHLDNQLTKNKWLASDQIQLCDICCAATISSLEILIPSLEQFTHLKKWMKILEEIPCFEINRKGVKRLQSFIDCM